MAKVKSLDDRIHALESRQEELRSRLDRVRGAQEELLLKLQEEFQVKTIEEAAILLAKKQKTLATWKSQLEQMIQEFEDAFSEQD